MNKLYTDQQLHRLWRAIHCNRYFLSSSVSGKRPPKKVLIDTAEKVPKKTIPIFTAASKLSKCHLFGIRQIKKMHAVILPQILVNFSGLGVPILDYYHYSSVPVIAVMMLLSHPIIIWTGSNRILNLSFDRQKREVYIQSVTEQVHTIPMDRCSLTNDKFAADDVKFCFYNLGNFNHRNVKVFKHLKSNDASSDEVGRKFRLDRTKGIISGSYWIFVVGSCLAMCVIYFTSGYTDLVYWLKITGDFAERLVGFSVFKKVFGHLIIQKS